MRRDRPIARTDDRLASAGRPKTSNIAKKTSTFRLLVGFLGKALPVNR